MQRTSTSGVITKTLILLEERLDADWVATYRFKPTEDGDLRMVDGRISSYGSGAVPDHDPPSSHFRRLHTDSSRFSVREILEWLEDSADDPILAREHLTRVLARFGLDYKSVMSSASRRSRRSDGDVARAADAYAGARQGRKLAAVAHAMPCSVHAPSKWIADARSRGFLARNGELTERGREALNGRP